MLLLYIQLGMQLFFLISLKTYIIRYGKHKVAYFLSKTARIVQCSTHCGKPSMVASRRNLQVKKAWCFTLLETSLHKKKTTTPILHSHSNAIELLNSTFFIGIVTIITSAIFVIESVKECFKFTIGLQELV